MKKDLSIISNSIIHSEKKRKNKEKEINSRVITKQFKFIIYQIDKDNIINSTYILYIFNYYFYIKRNLKKSVPKNKLLIVMKKSAKLKRI